MVVILLAFANLKVFKLNNIKSTNCDYDQLTKLLFRCGTELNQIKFMSSDGNYLTLNVIEHSPYFVRRLAEKCPTLTGR